MIKLASGHTGVGQNTAMALHVTFEIKHFNTCNADERAGIRLRRPLSKSGMDNTSDDHSNHSDR